MIDYQLAKLELDKFHTIETISSAHGLLCGYACVNPTMNLENWLHKILEEYDKNDDFSVFASIFSQTLMQLSDSELQFNLLLANDEDLCEQANNIVDWCNGFLVGLGLAKVTIQDNDVNEIIQDMSEIAKLDITLSNNEENANDLNEVIEFVRMSVLLIQETLSPSKIDNVSIDGHIH